MRGWEASHVSALFSSVCCIVPCLVEPQPGTMQWWVDANLHSACPGRGLQVPDLKNRRQWMVLSAVIPLLTIGAGVLGGGGGLGVVRGLGVDGGARV